ncbi:hypothetical protein FRC01_005417 [Tulasnella sp. 417]|nr:hypothetical protein FRC01_005417 [Tulasnella sp. 417]
MELVAKQSPRPSTIGDGTRVPTILERRRHNELLPIHRLPPELLHAIIVNSYTQVSYKHVFALRSTCKHWKEIVDSIPQLWAQIALHHTTDFLSTILQKSKARPLEVSCKKSNSENDRAFNERVMNFLLQVGPTTGRWGSLHYSASTGAQHGWILGLPLHNLETLSVRISGTAVNYTGGFAAPRLQNLDVHRLSLNWRSFSDLRSFQIDSCRPSPTVDELYMLLKSSPKLEHFKIARDWTSATGRATDLSNVHSTPILLPRLRSIVVVQVPFVSYSRLLDLVESPNLHRFLAFHHFQDFSLDFTPMFESAGRFIGAPGDSHGDDDTSRISISGTNDLFSVGVGDRRVILKNYEWARGTGQGERRAALATVLGHFDVTSRESIKMIRISGFRSQETTDIAHVLNRKLPNVEELEMKVCASSSALAGLSILGRVSSSPADRKEDWLFPGLFRFQFYATKYLACDRVLEVLKARNLGPVQAIRQLTIEGGRIRLDTVDKLREYLQEFNMTGTEVV